MRAGPGTGSGTGSGEGSGMSGGVGSGMSGGEGSGTTAGPGIGSGTGCVVMPPFLPSGAVSHQAPGEGSGGDPSEEDP